jgi:predicted RND superfamily exporter protein
VFCGVGVIATMGVALTFVPSLLCVLPVPERIAARRTHEGFDRLLERLAHFDTRHRRAILIAGAVVGCVALLGMRHIEVSTATITNLKADNPVRVHFDRINEQLEGASAFSVVLEADTPEAFKNPENLREIEALQGWLESQPEIGGTTSLVDYVKAINQGFHENAADSFTIPGSQALVSQLLLVGSNDELEQFVDADHRLTSVAVRTTVIDSNDVMGLVGRTEEFLRQLPGHLQARVTGNTVLLSRTMDDIAIGQALSLGMAFLVIYGLLSLLFTSFRAGLLALVPNALPVLIYFGILGWSGVTLNTTTGLVACLVLGIAVDDTIHMMVHFNGAARRHADEVRGVVEALQRVGRPVTYTTAALCLGFLCLTLSEMRSQVEFGVLSALTLGFAWLIDVTFTPALAMQMRVVTIWDVLTLDLGNDPQHSIPLFRGLRHAQARMVAALSRLEGFAQGELLTRIGEKGGSFYVVIDGELSATVSVDGRTVPLRRHGRGDVVGEVAIFHGERTADVRAETNVRLMCLTAESLLRLERRYPRIGARIYANLNEVLASRLASVTPRVR